MKWRVMSVMKTELGTWRSYMDFMLGWSGRRKALHHQLGTLREVGDVTKGQVTREQHQLPLWGNLVEKWRDLCEQNRGKVTKFAKMKNCFDQKKQSSRANFSPLRMQNESETRGIAKSTMKGFDLLFWAFSIQKANLDVWDPLNGVKLCKQFYL